MDFLVDPRLAALPNPYDPNARAALFYPWDASYFGGHYYLYHSALPVLLGYVPLKYLRYRYAPDQLIAA